MGGRKRIIFKKKLFSALQIIVTKWEVKTGSIKKNRSRKCGQKIYGEMGNEKLLENLIENFFETQKKLLRNIMETFEKLSRDICKT